MSHAPRWIALGLVTAAAIGGGVWVGLGMWPKGRSTTTLVLPGVVEVQEVRLGSKVGGRVREVLVTEGSLVEAGTPMVVFDEPELLAQRAQWAAKLQQAEADLEKAKNGARPEEIAAAEAATAAARARAKRMRLGFREEEIRQARDDLSSAEADLKLAEEQLGRYERLLEKKSVTQAEVDTARAEYDRDRGKAAAARAHSDMLNRGNRPEDISEADALRDQSQANLDLIKAGTRVEDIARLEGVVAETRSRLQEIEVDLDEATVRAPSRSVLDVLSVRKGDLVAAGQIVALVLRADDLWVRVYVPETELGKIRLNQSAKVTIDAYPGKRFEGKVVQVASISEFTPRNIQSVDERRNQVFGAKVRVQDPQGVFKSGMAAEVTITLPEKP